MENKESIRKQIQAAEAAGDEEEAERLRAKLASTSDDEDEGGGTPSQGDLTGEDDENLEQDDTGDSEDKNKKKEKDNDSENKDEDKKDKKDSRDSSNGDKGQSDGKGSGESGGKGSGESGGKGSEKAGERAGEKGATNASGGSTSGGSTAGGSASGGSAAGGSTAGGSAAGGSAAGGSAAGGSAAAGGTAAGGSAAGGAAAGGAAAGGAAAGGAAAGGSAAGGTAVALGSNPVGWVILIIIVVIVLIMLIIGFITFFKTMPGIVSDKVSNLLNNFIAWTESNFSMESAEAFVQRKDVAQLANYLEEKGYYLEEYGFIEQPIEYVYIAKNNEFLEIGGWDEPDRLSYTVIFEGTFEDFVERYNNNDFSEFTENYNTKEEIDAIEAGKIHIVYSKVAGSTEDEDIILSKKIDEISLNGIGDIYFIYSKYIAQYLAAENASYLVKNFNKNLATIFSNLFQSETTIAEDGSGLIYFMEDDDAYDKYGMSESDITGLNGAGTLVGAGSITNIFNFDIEINRDDNKMYIKNKRDGLLTRSWTTYDIDGWVGAYGMPNQLSLTLHLSTMAPEFAYQIAKKATTDTQLNMGLLQVDGNKSEMRALLNIDGEMKEYVIEKIPLTFRIPISVLTFVPYRKLDKASGGEEEDDIYTNRDNAENANEDPDHGVEEQDNFENDLRELEEWFAEGEKIIKIESHYASLDYNFNEIAKFGEFLTNYCYVEYDAIFEGSDISEVISNLLTAEYPRVHVMAYTKDQDGNYVKEGEEGAIPLEINTKDRGLDGVDIIGGGDIAAKYTYLDKLFCENVKIQTSGTLANTLFTEKGIISLAFALYKYTTDVNPIDNELSSRVGRIGSTFAIVRYGYRLREVDESGNIGEVVEFECDSGDDFVYVNSNNQKYYNYKLREGSEWWPLNANYEDADKGWFWQGSIPKKIAQALSMGEDLNNPNIGTQLQKTIEFIYDYNKTYENTYKMQIPFIISLTDHWYYTKLDFSDCYKWITVPDDAQNKIIYNPEDSDTDMIKRLANAGQLMVYDSIPGYIYQKKDPEKIGAGDYIYALITGGSYTSAYNEDSTEGTVVNFTGKNLFHIYDGTKKTSEDLTEDNKQTINFTDRFLDSIAMLETIGGKNAQIITRMFKELLATRFDIYFVESDLTTQTKQLAYEAMKHVTTNEDDFLPNGYETILKSKITGLTEGFSFVDGNSGFNTDLDIVVPVDGEIVFRTDDCIAIKVRGEQEVNSVTIENGITIMVKGLVVHEHIQLGTVLKGVEIGVTTTSDIAISFRDHNNMPIKGNEYTMVDSEGNTVTFTEEDEKDKVLIID